MQLEIERQALLKESDAHSNARACANCPATRFVAGRIFREESAMAIGERCDRRNSQNERTDRSTESGRAALRARRRIWRSVAEIRYGKLSAAERELKAAQDRLAE